LVRIAAPRERRRAVDESAPRLQERLDRRKDRRVVDVDHDERVLLESPDLDARLADLRAREPADADRVLLHDLAERGLVLAALVLHELHGDHPERRHAELDPRLPSGPAPASVARTGSPSRTRSVK
jgi:hypothetical protein